MGLIWFRCYVVDLRGGQRIAQRGRLERASRTFCKVITFSAAVRLASLVALARQRWQRRWLFPLNCCSTCIIYFLTVPHKKKIFYGFVKYYYFIQTVVRSIIVAVSCIIFVSCVTAAVVIPLLARVYCCLLKGSLGKPRWDDESVNIVPDPGCMMVSLCSSRPLCGDVVFVVEKAGMIHLVERSYRPPAVTDESMGGVEGLGHLCVCSALAPLRVVIISSVLDPNK